MTQKIDEKHAAVLHAALATQVSAYRPSEGQAPSLVNTAAFPAPVGSVHSAGGMAKQIAGKLEASRLPPEWAVYLAHHMALGGAKGYELDNWRKPSPGKLLREALLRHVLDYLAGGDVDPKDGSDLLDAIAANALMLRSKRDAGTLEDDRKTRPNYPDPLVVRALLYPEK